MEAGLKFCLISYKRQNVLSDWPSLRFMSSSVTALVGGRWYVFTHTQSELPYSDVAIDRIYL
jgi:hypothetical protein